MSLDEIIYLFPDRGAEYGSDKSSSTLTNGNGNMSVYAGVVKFFYYSDFDRLHILSRMYAIFLSFVNLFLIF